MRKLFDAFRLRQRMRNVALLAQNIADESLHDVWPRVAKLVHEMDAVEARGYVRVRATAVIRRQLRVSTAAQSLPGSALLKLTALASERVVQQVIAELLRQRSVSHRAAA